MTDHRSHLELTRNGTGDRGDTSALQTAAELCRLPLCSMNSYRGKELDESKQVFAVGLRLDKGYQRKKGRRLVKRNIVEMPSRRVHSYPELARIGKTSNTSVR
jgi:hypothetical protein